MKKKRKIKSPLHKLTQSEKPTVRVAIEGRNTSNILFSWICSFSFQFVASQPTYLDPTLGFSAVRRLNMSDQRVSLRPKPFFAALFVLLNRRAPVYVPPALFILSSLFPVKSAPTQVDYVGLLALEVFRDHFYCRSFVSSGIFLQLFCRVVFSSGSVWYMTFLATRHHQELPVISACFLKQRVREAPRII